MMLGKDPDASLPRVLVLAGSVDIVALEYWVFGLAACRGRRSFVTRGQGGERRNKGYSRRNRWKLCRSEHKIWPE